MDDAIHDVTVTGYEHLIDQLDLPDPDDRQVLAAAIHAEAQVIVTRNLRGFPIERLSAWGLEAQHPDDFLTTLHHNRPDTVVGIVAAIAVAWGAGRRARPSRHRRARLGRSRAPVSGQISRIGRVDQALTTLRNDEALIKIASHQGFRPSG